MKTSFIYYFLSKGGTGIISILSIIIFTRMLSPEEYGQLSITLSIVSLFCSIGYQWIALSIVRFNSSQETSPNLVTATATLLFVLSSSLIFITSYLWNKFVITTPYSNLEFLLLNIMCISLGAFTLVVQVLNSNGQAKKFALLNSIKSVMVFIISVSIFNYFGFSVLWVVLSNIVVIACLLLLYSPSFINLNLLSKSKHSDLFRAFVNYGFPLAISTLAILVIDLSDRFMIVYWYGNSELAAYTAAYDLIQQSVGSLFSILSLTFLPVIIKSYDSSDNSTYRKYLNKYYEFVLCLAFCVIALFCGMNEVIANIIFGVELREGASNLTPIVAVAILIGSIKTHFIDIPMKTNRKTKILLNISIFMAITNLACNYILIPEIGAYGGAVATLIAFTVGGGLSLHYSNYQVVAYCEKSLLLKICFCLAVLLLITKVVLVPSNYGLTSSILYMGCYTLVMLSIIYMLDFFKIRTNFKMKRF
ncbi:oligosaccharide flippase family protein [Colwellia sp. BRX10-4]|uniref:oligosaccharide flippase family protein n=1 Tax=Colwellia sp. BRX10-4 TaxID=2759843 RepID=UPI0015F62972|nr:oligosaccharide flippase family protein [Colwellia sp. BRX10-4]MBA6396522.1 polysaccharide biosynthesis protein [Colwellia sp. BRX10-4]